MSSKQDRTYTRTASDLERKLGLKDRFSQVMGIAEDAQRSAGEVLDSMVGANILTGTKDFSGDGWVGLGLWFDDGKYNGLTVKSRVGAWQALKQYINVIAGEVYTISAFVKSTARFSFTCDAGNTGTGEANTSKTYYDACTNWTRISNTFTVTETGTIAPGFESTGSGDQLWICGLKIERGNKATEWSPSPLDDADLTHEKVFNALTNNGQFQGIYRGDDGDVYINASYIMTGILTSADGTVKIDLGNNKVTIETDDGAGNTGRLELTRYGIRGYGYNKVTGALEETLRFTSGSINSNGSQSLSGIFSNSGVGLSIVPASGQELLLGGYGRKTILYGDTVEFLGKTFSWKDNGDGTFTLIGT